jgi:hypothetical protein
VTLKRPPIPDKTKLPAIFRAFCDTTARQHALGQMPLADAVDWLHDWAVTRGVVDELGEDAVQAMIASAFAPLRTDLESPAKPDDQYEGLSSTFAAACRKADAEHGPVPDPPEIPLVSQHGVPSAETLQREYEANLRRRRRDVPQSTLDAATYLRQVGDQARFQRWLEEHHPDDQVAILAYLESKATGHAR